MPNARVVIAHSDIADAENIAEILNQLGYDVVACVASGKEAAEQIHLTAPDLLLVSSELITNQSSSTFIATALHDVDIPIVTVATQRSPTALYQVKLDNLYGCVVKPFTPQQFRINIEVALQAHHQARKLNNQKQVEVLLARRNSELNLLNRASQVFVSTLDLDQVLVTILEAVQQTLEVVACSAWLIDVETREVVCRQVTDPHSATVRGWRLPIGQGLVGEVASTGQSMIVPDILTDPRHFKGVDEQTGLNLRSILSVPLRIKDKIIGVIQVVDEKIDRFDQSHIELVEPLAAIAAVIIENARLYEEMNQLRLFSENIVNNVEEGILIIDPSQQIFFINLKGAQILEYKVDELINENILDLISARHRDSVSSKLKQPGSEFATKFETVVTTKEGEEIPVIFSANSLFEGEQFIGTLAVFIDISRRKKTEELLRKLSRAVEQTADHMMITNREGVIEYVNPAFQKLTGFTGTDIIGKTPRILKSGEHEEQFYERMWHTLERGNVFRGIVINKKKNGTLFYEEQTITPIKDIAGHITHFVATGKDITERRLAEETLKEAVDVLRRQNRELDTLNRAGHKLISSLDIDEVLGTVLEEARELLGAVACSIWLVDPESAKGKNGMGELVCRRAIGPNYETVQGWRLSPGEGVAGWVVQSGESLIIPDLASDDRHFKGVDRRIGLTLRSLISVPLKRATYGSIGALHVLDEAVDRFTISDLILVESLAATATVAIENAQLFAQVQEDAKTKSVLLDEINHRVKNNLSAIIGLLFAEQGRVQVDNHALYQSIVTGLINRVQSLATVHSLLSDAEWSPLSLERLAEQVVHSALQGSTLDRNILVKISPSPIRIPPAQAHYLAMVINELTTNSVKHAFSNVQNQAEIVVDIRPKKGPVSDLVELEFRDNGPGFPDAVLQAHQESCNVGFDLIRNIVRRSLRGNLTLVNDNGAVVVVEFELAKNSKLTGKEKKHDEKP